MDYRWLAPERASSRVWVYLQGAYSSLADGAAGFERIAAEAGVHLFFPQGSRVMGSGFAWSFAADAESITRVLIRECAARGLAGARVEVIGNSMGCAMALWLLRRNPGRFAAVAALGMGSAFEQWDGDDGGFPPGSLTPASGARFLLAVDLRDPAGGPPHVAGYFAPNLARLRAEGFAVETFRPDVGTHAVTDAMRGRVREFLGVADA